MPVPDYQSLMRPVLAAFADGERTVRDILPDLVRELGLSSEEAEERVGSGTKTLLADRAHWARTYLAKAGLLHSPRRGTHVITERGREVLARHPVRIDNSVLRACDGFEAWVRPAAQGDGADVRPSPAADLTPLDRLDAAYAEIEATLADEVLEAVLSLSPGRFEQLVVDLLIAMGYGGGDLARGTQTSLSRDGGIDGVVNEDALGLDAIYVQAKRYDPANKVGRPALNGFVGSLTGEGATKGVFVTTSSFSADARAFVDRVQHRIVLIDGQRLARLLIAHEVGVRARKTYVIRSVDEDYFLDT